MTGGGHLFSEKEMRALLNRDEGQFLEFKSMWDQESETPRTLKRPQVRDTIADYVAAFANADGGLLVLGVEDDGRPTGHRYPDDAVRDFMAVPERRLRPAVRCRVDRLRIGGSELLVFDVPNVAEAVMVEGNGFPYRVGDQVVREPQEIINRRKEAYRRVGYEQRVRPEATLDDLDLELAGRFVQTTPIGSRPIEEVLTRYGLLQSRASGSGVTNAGLLLFGKPPLVRWHPRAGIRLFRVAGSERQHGAARNVTQIGRVEAPIASAIPEVHRLAREHIRRSEKLHDLFFRETPEYPEFAWQEAIVNAFAHRDYEVQGQEIEVWFFDDRMEVRSPGDLVPPVTLDLLRQRRPIHASRNPLLVRVLAEAGLMREEGEGIPRIFDEMEASFLHAPELHVETGAFVITLRNEPIFTGPSAAWQTLVERLPLRQEQKRVLLAHPEGFANEDYRRLNSVDRDEAYRQIQEMVGLGIVTPAEAPGRGAVYRVAPNLRDARVFLEDRTPRLRTFFTRRPSLQNSDYRALFGVTRTLAKRELGLLVERGVLVREGERRGARYTAGVTLKSAGGE
jgi:ATP-dependent DNA helicase RecG